MGHGWRVLGMCSSSKCRAGDEDAAVSSIGEDCWRNDEG
jgi:hypothetical protein